MLLLLLGTAAFADQANVFIYHRFNDPRYPSTNISREDFRAQLDLLHQQGVAVLPLGEVIRRLQQDLGLPQPCAVITVDDAYRSFLTDAWPLLQRYGFPATLFVSSDAVGGGDYLDWQELAALQSQGVDIGNHSASHAFLLDRVNGESDAAWTARVAADINRAQQAFVEHLGVAPGLFAYPYGEYSPELAALVESLGFAAAVGQQSGVVTAAQDLFSLPRFPVGGDHASLGEFRSKLFMRHLAVRIVSPASPVLLAVNPPPLQLYITQGGLNRGSLRCYAQGMGDCLVRAVEGDSDLYEVVATQPLAGRRGKYTLTAADVAGRTWYWYSQLWIRPDAVEMTDHAVAR